MWLIQESRWMPFISHSLLRLTKIQSQLQRDEWILKHFFASHLKISMVLTFESANFVEIENNYALNSFSLLLFLRYATHINYHLQLLFGCWIWMNSQEKAENLCKNRSVNGTTKMWLTMKFKLNYFENEHRRTHSQYMHTMFTWFKIAVQNQKHGTQVLSVGSALDYRTFSYS